MSLLLSIINELFPVATSVAFSTAKKTIEITGDALEKVSDTVRERYEQKLFEDLDELEGELGKSFYLKKEIDADFKKSYVKCYLYDWEGNLCFVTDRHRRRWKESVHVFGPDSKVVGCITMKAKGFHEAVSISIGDEGEIGVVKYKDKLETNAKGVSGTINKLRTQFELSLNGETLLQRKVVHGKSVVVIPNKDNELRCALIALGIELRCEII